MDSPGCQLIFRDWQLAIESNLPEVIASCQHQFQHLVNSHDSVRPANRLRVDQEAQNGLYRISRTGSSSSLQTDNIAAVSRLLSQEIIAHFMEVCPELLWMHAGAVVDNGGAVMFVGPWGQGKSTMVAAMIRRGWGYLSDDVVPIDLENDLALPFPRTPFRRLGPTTELPIDQVSGLNKTEVPLLPEQVCQSAQPVRAIVFPVWQPKAQNVLSCKPPGETGLALLENCMNFPAHQTAAVRLVGRLLAAVPAFDLYLSNEDEASRLIVDQSFHHVRAEFAIA